jgi:hypothetical protein
MLFMQGNNSQSKSSFIKALGSARKKELAEMLFAGASFETAEKAGFNKAIVQEMARNIKNTVENAENFVVGTPLGVQAEPLATIASQPDGIVAATDPVSTATPVDPTLSANTQNSTDETKTEVPTEGTDPTDQTATVETEVPTAPVDPTVPTQNVEQGTPNQAVPQS